MPSTRTGLAAIIGVALAASALMLADAARAHRGVFHQGAAAAQGGLPLDAPLPRTVPPGVTLTIGDPTTQAVLQHLGWDRLCVVIATIPARAKNCLRFIYGLSKGQNSMSRV